MKCDDRITFLVNSEKQRDDAMRNTGTGFVVLSHHSLLKSLVHAFKCLIGCNLKLTSVLLNKFTYYSVLITEQ